jgi:hypothetical protein
MNIITFLFMISQKLKPTNTLLSVATCSSLIMTSEGPKNLGNKLQKISVTGLWLRALLHLHIGSFNYLNFLEKGAVRKKHFAD